MSPLMLKLPINSGELIWPEDCYAVQHRATTVGFSDSARGGTFDHETVE
jgi:hypothetical protein